MNMNVNEKEIQKSNKNIDLSGFKMQDNLNPKIWELPNEKYMGDVEGQIEKMKPDVRKTLLKIADDYFESLDLPGVDIEDITMTGSLSNYNWSKYSDVDLHIVVDYDELPMDRELVQGFFKSKTDIWNDTHEVKIYGYDVELYIQDINEPHHSTGIYSILNNEWNVKPEKKKISIDNTSVKEKSERIMDCIEDIFDDMDEVDNDITIKRVEKLIDKIKKMRKSGLETGGEFSVENIVFKVLRRNGMLDRLYDIKTVTYDKSVTLESSQLTKLTESMLDDELDDGLGWIKDTEFNFKIGDVFVTKHNFHNTTQKRSERTFEIYDVSPDGNRLRFTHHDTRGIGVRGKAYLPIDKINAETISRGWDRVGYNPANSITTEQAIKNITSGFWVKLNVNGYLIDNPSEYDKIIKLGSNRLSESEWDWVDGVDPLMVPELLKNGQKFIQHLPKGENRVLQFIRKNGENISYERPLTLFYFKVVSGWLTGQELLFNTLDLVEMFKKGGLEPILDDYFEFLGESEEDPLQWMKDTNPKKIVKGKERFDSEEMIVLNYFNKKSTQKEGKWKYYIDGMSGSIEWSKDGFDTVFLATPFWNGEPNLPIDYQDNDGYGDVTTISLPKFNYEEELTNWLKDEYPKIVHQEITNFIHDNELDPESINERLLSDINPKHQYTKVKNNFKTFLEMLKREGKENKEAWSLITNSIKEKRKLTQDEQKKVLGQLGNMFKISGLSLAMFLPGGILYILLTRVPRFKKYLLPTDLSNIEE